MNCLRSRWPLARSDGGPPGCRSTPRHPLGRLAVDGHPVALPPLPAASVRRDQGPGPRRAGAAQRRRPAVARARPTCSPGRVAPARPRRRASWPRCSTASAPVDGEPCCECASCLASSAAPATTCTSSTPRATTASTSIRDLIEKASLGTPGRHKVYILDEVHMLSKAGRGRAAEDARGAAAATSCSCSPPPIRRRCPTPSAAARSTCAFHLLPPDTLAEHVRWVAADAGLDVSDDAIERRGRAGRRLGPRHAVGARADRQLRRRRRRAPPLRRVRRGAHRPRRRAGRSPRWPTPSTPGTTPARSPRSSCATCATGSSSLMAPELVQLPSSRRRRPGVAGPAPRCARLVRGHRAARRGPRRAAPRPRPAGAGRGGAGAAHSRRRRRVGSRRHRGARRPASPSSSRIVAAGGAAARRRGTAHRSIRTPGGPSSAAGPNGPWRPPPPAPSTDVTIDDGHGRTTRGRGTAGSRVRRRVRQLAPGDPASECGDGGPTVAQAVSPGRCSRRSSWCRPSTTRVALGCAERGPSSALRAARRHRATALEGGVRTRRHHRVAAPRPMPPPRRPRRRSIPAPTTSCRPSTRTRRSITGSTVGRRARRQGVSRAQRLERGS